MIILSTWLCDVFQNQPPEVFCKKSLRSATLLKKETLAQTCNFIEKEALAQACNFIKKETLAQVFSRKFCEISKNTFSYRTALVAASGYLKKGSTSLWIERCPFTKFITCKSQLHSLCGGLHFKSEPKHQKVIPGKVIWSHCWRHL